MVYLRVLGKNMLILSSMERITDLLEKRAVHTSNRSQLPTVELSVSVFESRCSTSLTLYLEVAWVGISLRCLTVIDGDNIGALSINILTSWPFQDIIPSCKRKRVSSSPNSKTTLSSGSSTCAREYHYPLPFALIPAFMKAFRNGHYAYHVRIR